MHFQTQQPQSLFIIWVHNEVRERPIREQSCGKTCAKSLALWIYEEWSCLSETMWPQQPVFTLSQSWTHFINSVLTSAVQTSWEWNYYCLCEHQLIHNLHYTHPFPPLLYIGSEMGEKVKHKKYGKIRWYIYKNAKKYFSTWVLKYYFWKVVGVCRKWLRSTLVRMTSGILVPAPLMFNVNSVINWY